jgi:membrane protein implicated in regulation of membrane protease activity
MESSPTLLDQIREALRLGPLLAWHIWLLLALAMGILEMFTPGFVLLCFGCGAVAAAAADLLGFHGLTLQLAIFAAVTFASFFTLRPALYARVSRQRDATNVEAIIGAEGIVTGAAAQGEVGTVRVRGELWRAEGAASGSLGEGERVRVLRVEGNRVIVERT